MEIIETLRNRKSEDSWRQNDEKMSRKTGNAQTRATFFRHSADPSLQAVMLRKVSNTLKATVWRQNDYSVPRSRKTPFRRNLQSVSILFITVVNPWKLHFETSWIKFSGNYKSINATNVYFFSNATFKFQTFSITETDSFLIPEIIAQPWSLGPFVDNRSLQHQSILRIKKTKRSSPKTSKLSFSASHNFGIKVGKRGKEWQLRELEIEYRLGEDWLASYSLKSDIN